MVSLCELVGLIVLVGLYYGAEAQALLRHSTVWAASVGWKAPRRGIRGGIVTRATNLLIEISLIVRFTQRFFGGK